MKVKTFILTFLMMMSSPFLFGQHWTDPGELYQPGTMQFTSKIYLDNELQTNTSYEIAVFNGTTLLEVANIVAIGSGENTLYHVDLNVQGTNGMGDIYFKLYNGEKEFVSVEKIQFQDHGSGGTHIAPSEIHFKTVAQIEDGSEINGSRFDVVYPTVAAALTAAQTDDVVQIFAGTYNQALDINKDITVVGERGENGEYLVIFEAGLSITADGATAKDIYVYNPVGNGVYVNAKDVLIEGCDIAGDNGARNCYTKGTVTFRNSYIGGATYGIHFDGSANGNIVIEGCQINGWTSFASTITSVAITDTDFLGDADYRQLRFYQDATVENVTFPAGMRIDTGNGGTGMEGIEVKFNGCSIEGGNLEDAFPGSVIAKSDIYVDNVLLKREAKIGDTYYETLADAYTAATDGQTITLLADITLSEIFVIEKSITFNGNGKTLTSTAGRAINVDCEGNVGIKNLTINASGERAINVIQKPANVTIDNVTATAANYTVNLASSAGAAKVAISNSTLNGLCTVNVAAAGSQVTVDYSTVNCNDNNTTAGESYAALCLNKEAVGGSIVATNTTVNVTEGSDSTKGRNGAENGTVTINGSTEGVAVMVAVITYEGSAYYYSFATLKDAIEFAKTGDDVTLIRDVTIDELVKIEKAVTLDLNGKTVTANCKKAFEVYANATIKNGKIWSQQRCVDTRKNVELTLADVTLEAPTYYSTHLNQQPLTIGGYDNGTKVTMTNVNIDAGTQGYAIISYVKTNLTATNSNFSGYSALYVKEGSEGSEFNFVGSTLKGDLGSNDVEGNSFATIATEAVDVTVTLDANSKLEAVGDNQFAMVLRAEENNITVEGDITATNFLSGNVNNNTIKVKAEYADDLLAEGYVTSEADANGLVQVSGLAVAKIGNTYYKTLQEAFNAAQSGETIQLLADNNENISVGTENLKPYGKTVIVEGNDFEVTGSWKFGRDDNNADNAEITINNVNFKNNGIVVDDFKNVTITNCTFTDITSELAAIRVICDNITEMVTLTGNTIENVSYDNGSGIRVRSAKAATISDNVITNVNFNSILLEGTTNGEVKIENNVLKNWAYANGNAADDGRAIRIAKGEGTLTIANNAMIIGYIAPEEFVKVSGTTSDVSIDANYWNAEEPNAPTHFNAEIGVKSYYAAFDEETKELSDLRLINFVAAIGDNKYQTLQAAIDAATAGDVIVLLADNITEDVIVNNAVTINGKPEENAEENSTYTGMMTVKADLTIKNVNFDGKGYNGYAVETRGANYLTVEDCTAKNYGFGFIQLASGTALTTVKNVTVSNMNYGVKVDYSNAVVLENLNLDCAVAAVLNSNYGTKTITIKDSYLSILGTWARNETIKTTYVFEGANTVDQFIIEEELDNFKLAIGATLTAVEGLNISATEEGYDVEYNEGVYSVVPGNVWNKTANKKYAKFQVAIDEASKDDVIVLLKDIEENVTITKDLTIDGKAADATVNSEYTGTMTVNTSLTVTVQNVNFVKGSIAEAEGSRGNLTVKGCNFDGVDKSIGYAVTVRGGDKLTIENSTAMNYSTGMLYIPRSVANIAIKDVEVSNVVAAFNITYSGDGTFENVKVVENVTYGIHFQIYGTRTYTVKNCDLKGATNPFWFWDKSNNTEKVTVVFEGNNDLGTKGIAVNAGELKLATDATLTAAEGLDIKATEEGYVVEYNENEGVYSVVAGNVLNSTTGKKFATIQAAIDAAVDNDVIVLLEDVTYTWDNVILNSNNYAVLLNVSGKDITLDMNGKTISVNHQSTTDRIYAVVCVEDGAGLTFTGGGTIDVNVDDNAPKVAYMFWKRGSGSEAGHLTIENGTFHMDNSEDSMVYTNGSGIVKVNGGTFTLDKVGTRDNGFPHIFSTYGQNVNNITVNGGTFNADVLHQYYAFEVNSSVNNALVDNGNGTWTIVTDGAVAYVTERYTTFSTDYSNEVGYATLADAVAAANKYDQNGGWLPTITLLADVVELENTITIAAGEEVILDLNGKTITGKDKYESGSFNLFVNNGTFEIKDGPAEGTGKITLEATTNRYWNASSSIVSNSAGTLTITSVTLEHLGGTDMAYAIDNNSTLGLTTLNVDGGKITSPYRAIRQFQNSLQDNVVVVNGGTISARAGIWMQQPSTNDKAQLGTLTINDGSIFECVSNAVVIDICGGAQSNVTINGGTFSNTNENANLLLIWPLTDMNSVHENCSAVMNITGGNFTCAGEGNLIGILDGADTNGDVVLTGGIYSEDVNAYCAEGFAAVDNGDGTWEVMPAQEQYLGAGYNWYSSYLNINTNNLLEALGESGISVAGNNWIATYYSSGWDYESHELDFSKMYMIETNQEHTLKLTGELLNAGEIDIDIEQGWNWIGYPSNERVEINTALTNHDATDGDRIVTQGGFVEYASMYGGWIGSAVFTHFEPTKGYQYFSANTEVELLTFNYNIVPATTRGNNETAVATHYSVDYTKYPFNMTMVAVVDGAIGDNYEVVALVNGEVRGSARPVYVEALDTYMLFLTISGDEVEEVSFKYYDITTEEEYELVNRIEYSNNAMVGSVNEPYVLSRGTTGIGEAAMSNINIYPNPTTTGREINLQATCDTVEVFNALGVKVAEYQNVDTIDALETAGIYVIRITNDGNVQNCRLVVK